MDSRRPTSSWPNWVLPTLWGLNDGRSWRGSEYPLLFDDDLSAKPAFFGAVYGADVLDAEIWDRWERPALPTVGP